MFAKILLIILSIAATLFIVLVHRQERLNIANEMTRMHTEIVELETRIWELRTDIAERTRPEVIREQMRQIETDWTPIPAASAPDGTSDDDSPNRPSISPASNTTSR